LYGFWHGPSFPFFSCFPFLASMRKLAKKKKLSFWFGGGNVTKNRRSEITQHTDCLHDPKRPCFPNLLHTDTMDAYTKSTSVIAYSFIYKIPCEHKLPLLPICSSEV
jgi:hypothetical protein